MSKSPQVKTFDKAAIKARLKKSDPEAYNLILALEEIIEVDRQISAKAISKIRDINNQLQEAMGE